MVKVINWLDLSRITVRRARAAEGLRRRDIRENEHRAAYAQFIMTTMTSLIWIKNKSKFDVVTISASKDMGNNMILPTILKSQFPYKDDGTFFLL